MDAELTLSLAFFAGLAGAGHCLGMCGGLVGGAFVGGVGGMGFAHAQPILRPLRNGHLAYHAARVLAYTLIGALAAGIGQALVLTGGVGRAQGLLYIVAGALVVWAGFNAMRRPVGCASQRLAHPPVAGFFNGLMPCSLVFSLALKAATAPSIVTGAAWLFAFGLGTVPAMLAAGVLAQWLGTQGGVWLRRAGGLAVVSLGIEAIWAGAQFFQVMLHL